ncbi:MAG: hypothetical protein ACKPKO_23900, partial [Candidatus Fonsibacter sp.]
MYETVFSQRVTRLSRAARTKAQVAIALREQLDMLSPTEFASSRIAMLEDRVRQLEDADGMLSEYCGMVTTDIELMLANKGQHSSVAAASVAVPDTQTVTRSSTHGRKQGRAADPATNATVPST